MDPPKGETMKGQRLNEPLLFVGACVAAWFIAVAAAALVDGAK